MSEFVDQLEQELRAATQRRLRLEAARLALPGAGPVVVLISLAVCVAVLLVATQIHARPAVQHQRPAHSPTLTRPVNPRIVANFSAFRRPRTRSDRLPSGLRFGLCGGEGPGNYSACSNGQPTTASGPVPTADPANGWRLEIYGHVHYLQANQSRRIRLPDKLGSIWLIPSGGWLCAFLDGPRWQRYTVRMRCGTIGLVLRRPPIDFPGFFFGPTAHGIMMAAEPDTITSAVIAYPGGTETAALRGGALAACVGQGPYKLKQTTASGGHIKPIDVGAYGPFKPVSCPALHVTIP
jgi:hypothetical protein